jgi:hypothetical protein
LQVTRQCSKARSVSGKFVRWFVRFRGGALVRPLLGLKTKGDPYHKVAPVGGTPPETQTMRTYSKKLNSSRQLRLIHDSGLARRVLEKAETEIRDRWQTLPLWAYRAFQHVNRGSLPYCETWRRLHAAALDAGAQESWVDRALFHSVSNANIHRQAPPELAQLAGGLR